MEDKSSYRPEQNNRPDYTIEHLDENSETPRIAFECNSLDVEVAKFDEPLVLGQGMLEEPITLGPGVGAYLDYTPFGDDNIHPEKLTETYYKMYKGFETMLEVFSNDESLPDIDFFYGNTNPRMAKAMERFGFTTYGNGNSSEVYYHAKVDDVVSSLEDHKQKGLIEKLEKRMGKN